MFYLACNINPNPTGILPTNDRHSIIYQCPKILCRKLGKMQITMETIKIQSISEFAGKNGTIYNIVAENDTRKFVCFNAEIKGKEGQSIEAEIKENTFNGRTSYIVNLPKAGGKPFVKSNADRQIALQSAVNWLKGTEAKKEQVIQLAEYFLTWLKK